MIRGFLIALMLVAGMAALGRAHTTFADQRSIAESKGTPAQAQLATIEASSSPFSISPAHFEPALMLLLGAALLSISTGIRVVRGNRMARATAPVPKGQLNIGAV